MEADSTDTDSTFQDGSTTGSTSLRSEVTKYIHEYGRRFHGYKAGHYLYPNDESELERMDIEHQNQMLQLGALHLAPLNKPQQILDIGTGTGIWAIDMADQYPSAQVIGTDLAPIQPNWIPPNCKFEIDDFEQEWTWGNDRFDMVHYRFLLGSVTDYKLLFRRIYDALKPGGWFELSDMNILMCSDDGTYSEDNHSVKWGKYFTEACEKLGRTVLKVEDYKPLIEEAGFVDVQQKILPRPTNDWPKDVKMKQIGCWCYLNFMEGVQAFSIVPFTRALGWTEEEVEVFLVDVRNEWKSRSLHGYHQGIAVWGRKPGQPPSLDEGLSSVNPHVEAEEDVKKSPIEKEST